jgi:hypothetical protein
MKIFRYINLNFAFVMLAIGVMTSCDDDDVKSSGAVELLSFGPAGVQHGEQITFFGNNLDKVTAIVLPGVTIASSSFIEHSHERILLTVPSEAEAGAVALITPEGEITSKSTISFNVPVTIESITPEVKPGTPLTITGQFMNWVEEVVFAEGVSVTEFVSRSLNELVVLVPLEAQTGPILLVTGGTEPLEVETESDVIITLPSIGTFTPAPVERGADLTITGENLDLVTGVLFKGITEPITDFTIESETKIIITVPLEANKGVVTLIAHSAVEVVSAVALEIAGDLPPLPPLAAAIFIDALENGFEDWSYGGAVDKANADNVRDGDVAVKKTFDGSWDAVRFGGGSLDPAGKTEFVFSVYGDVGMGGQEMNVIINDNWSIQTITITEGEWVEHKFTLEDFGSPATISDWGLQAKGSTGVIFIDHVGLR